MSSRNRTKWVRLLGVFAAFLMLAAACGSGDSEESASDGDAVEEADSSETDAGDTDSSETDAGDTDSSETDAEDTNAGETDAMTQQRGGTLTYLVEAESDSFAPGSNCAASCIQVMRSVADPLTIVNSDNEVEPFLLESLEANADFTEFTLVMREGVTFHDGTPADGAALHQNLLVRQAHPVAGQQFFDIAADGIVLVDDMTVSVSMNRPVATFGRFLSERNGWLLAPSFLNDPEIATAFPIGTGPFVMTERVRDEQTVLAANPDYWRTDANGEALPYLDEVVFRPVPDPNTRRAIIESGDADASMDSTTGLVGFWQNEWAGGLVDTADPREVNFLLFNNAAAPFDNPDMRRAIALCTDRNEYLTFRAPDSQLVNGPFAEGDLGYLEETGLPSFDPEAGSALLDEIGRPDVINYSTLTNPESLLTAELFADQWATNCGLTVNIDQFDQAAGITKLLTGDFQVVLTRNHGQGDPGLELGWWHSRHTTGLALNFARIADPELDELLHASQATNDLAELDEVAKQINQRFGSEIYILWLNSVVWSHPFQDGVHGIGSVSLDSGNVAQTSIAGRTWLTEAWVEG